MRGEIGKDGRVLVIRRIHVTYRLRVPEDVRDVVKRVREAHADVCPVARTIRECVAIDTSVEFV